MRIQIDRRLIFWTTVGGAIGGGLNGLSLWVGWPSDFSDAEFSAWILPSGQFHGACLGLGIGMAVSFARWRRLTAAAAMGILCGWISPLAFYLLQMGRRFDGSALSHDAREVFGELGTSAWGFSWAMMFGLPVVLCGSLAEFASRGRPGRWPAVPVYAAAAAIGALAYWTIGFNTDLSKGGIIVEWKWENIRLAFVHGACFGTCVSVARALAMRGRPGDSQSVDALPPSG